MKKTRTTEIIIETHEVLILKRAAQYPLAWCPACQRTVRMIPREAAAGVARVTAKTLGEWVEAGKVHFCESWEATGKAICLDSVLQTYAAGQAGNPGKS